MDVLSAFAGELDALVRDGRRIRLGDRNVEAPYAALDEMLGRMRELAGRMRAGAPPIEGQARALPPVLPVTGRGQILRVVARGPGR